MALLLRDAGSIVLLIAENDIAFDQVACAPRAGPHDFCCRSTGTGRWRRQRPRWRASICCTATRSQVHIGRGAAGRQGPI